MSGRIQPVNRGGDCAERASSYPTPPRERDRQADKARCSCVSAVEVHGLLPMQVFIPSDDCHPFASYLLSADCTPGWLCHAGIQQRLNQRPLLSRVPFWGWGEQTLNKVNI